MIPARNPPGIDGMSPFHIIMNLSYPEFMVEKTRGLIPRMLPCCCHAVTLPFPPVWVGFRLDRFLRCGLPARDHGNLPYRLTVLHMKYYTSRTSKLYFHCTSGIPAPDPQRLPSPGPRPSPVLGHWLGHWLVPPRPRRRRLFFPLPICWRN